ncbi:MAG: cytochrome c-type biogenesis protein [Pseudomonadota bacterium]
MRGLIVLFALMFAVVVTPIHAATSDEVLDDPALEERARALSVNLRCLVCQNQSIDDSDAPLAKDLRVLVRERLVAGDTDQQVLDFVVARYGEYVLMKPRFAGHTLILWLAAPLLFGVAAIVIGLKALRKTKPLKRTPAIALSPEEEARVAALLDKDAGG